MFEVGLFEGVTELNRDVLVLPFRAHARGSLLPSDELLPERPLVHADVVVTPGRDNKEIVTDECRRSVLSVRKSSPRGVHPFAPSPTFHQL